MRSHNAVLVSLRRWTLRTSIILLALFALAACDREDADDDSEQQEQEVTQDQPEADDSAQEEADGDDVFGDLSALFDPASLATQEDAEEWSGSSPPAIYFISYFSPVIATVGLDDDDDSDCPDITESDDGAMDIATDCVDDEGREWSGSASVSAPESEHDILFPGLPGSSTIGVSRLELDDLRFAGPKNCISDQSVEADVDVLYNGFVELSEVGENQYAFEVDLVIDGTDIDDQSCEVEEGKTVLQYRGEYELLEFNDDEEATVHEWSGEGAMGHEDEGWARLTTTVQRFDIGACEHKPTSGTTVLASEDTELEYRYDGADNCDEEATAPWYLDGEQQGTVEGVNCSATGGTSGMVTIISLLLVLGFLRRKRSPKPACALV